MMKGFGLSDTDTDTADVHLGSGEDASEVDTRWQYDLNVLRSVAEFALTELGWDDTEAINIFLNPADEESTYREYLEWLDENAH